MAHLALALDAFTDVWQLADGTPVDVGIADAMAWALGTDVLVYRNMEMQGAYFGVARLIRIGVSTGEFARTLLFDNIRMFTVELAYPAGVTMLTRLQYLDDSEFLSIVRQGRPTLLTAVGHDPFDETTQELLIGRPAPDIASIEDMIAAVRREARETCAVTGERVGKEGRVSIIWPKGGRSALDSANLLFVAPAADDGLRAGHITLLDDFSILANMARIDHALLSRINLTGRLLLPVDSRFHPSAENLAFHRRFVFGLG